MQNIVILAKKKIGDKYIKDKKYHKVKDHCHYRGEYRGAAHSICNLKQIVPKEKPTIFNNGSYYHSHCIMKKTRRRIGRKIQQLKRKC